MIALKRLQASLAIICFLTAGLLTASAQNKSEQKESRPSGTPVLWRAPDDLPSRDLYLGPGGEAMKPDLSRVTFIKDETGGYSTKFRVRDGSGREWVAKVGKEAQSETAAVRLVWAVGYMTEVNYLIPRLNVEGKGAFENVRLEARPENVKRLDEWKWSENPFKGTKELQGLVIIMALLNNWDIKDINNKVLRVRDEASGREELHYIVSDLGIPFQSRLSGSAEGRATWGPVSGEGVRRRPAAEGAAPAGGDSTYHRAEAAEVRAERRDDIDSSKQLNFLPPLHEGTPSISGLLPSGRLAYWSKGLF